MASTDHSNDHQKQRKPIMIQRRPMMLKDYLRDDLLSSCSSNGFKSFPRRQCCTTIRFLLEVDLKASRKQQRLRRSRSKAPASTTISALQRASDAVISAVKKQLPFHSLKSHSPSQRNGDKKGLVPRSLSRKLFFGRSFWRKTDKRDNDLRRWRLFRDILKQQDKPSDHHSATSVVGGWVSMSTSCSSNTDSWAESEFTSEILGSSSGKSESSSENHVVGSKSGPPEMEIGRSIGETVCEDSISEATTANFSGANAKVWSNEKEKVQFSPVSVLDCPFHEDDEDTSSPTPHDKLGRIEGTKQKLSHKMIRQFECLAQLEPVDLEKRIALSAGLNHEAPHESLVQTCSMSTLENNTFDNQTEKKAEELLDLINTRRSVNGAKFKADNLLSDFFWERIEENINASASTSTRGIVNGFESELLKVAEDWLSGGNPLELLLGWEVEDGREVYVRDMEKGGKWRILVEEKEESGLEVEFEVWISLLDELVLDLFS
ncbi:hypothetical protein F2P56_004905 [Juglans regia]|uniref:Uncharacterized protein LOC109011568 n=2 Tax=Juglans regia TaxID=51240 RepID=A0A2I4GWT5_JUGRE|nr:uncharacterized protein LOC109011568 [Juglans regia]KAF5478339.1 hypothetical protein F2P56_004905 [Juglans regia]